MKNASASSGTGTRPFPNVFYNPELNRLRWNGRQRAMGQECDFCPVIRLWIPSTPLQWFLTDIDIEDEEWIYGLCIGAADETELNYWSRSQFESLASPKAPFRLESSTQFGIQAPLSSYLRAVTRKKTFGF